MKTAKLFMTGRSQAVRLPKEFRFEGKEVYVTRSGNSVLLTPKNRFDWNNWFDTLSSIDATISEDRDQKEQQREGLDDLFA